MKIEFHYDFGSPNAYLVHKVIPATTARTGIEFEHVPVLLGGVFKATNNVSPAVSLQGIRNKPEYQRIETERFCRAHGIEPYKPNPHFPVNTLKMMRGAVFARSTDCYARYVDAMYDAMWAGAESGRRRRDSKRAGDRRPACARDLRRHVESRGQAGADCADRSVGEPRDFRVTYTVCRGRDVLRQGQAARRGRSRAELDRDTMETKASEPELALIVGGGRGISARRPSRVDEFSSPGR